MRFRSTFILLGVFLVLGGYVYFTEYRGSEERAKQEEAKKKVFSAPLKDVVELSLAFPDRKVSAVKKEGKGWEITEPAGLDADSEAWDMLVSSLEQIEKAGTVVAASSDLAPYGLDKPVVRVTAKMKDGKYVGVSFGGENPKKTQVYTKLADGMDVFLSPTSSLQAFQKTTTDLRNKKVLDFAVEDIQSIRIEDGKNQMVMQKSGMDWTLKKTAELKADAPEVGSFLGTIQSSRASGFADEKVTLASAGLAPAAVKVVLHDGKANSDRVVSFGKSPEPDKYYARDESRSTILIVDKEIVDKARRPLLDWRDKSIAHVDAATVDEIEIARGSEKVLLKKQAGNWQFADGRKAQSEKISNVLIMVEFARATQIVDVPGSPVGYGLDKPRLEVQLRQAGKDVLGLKFGSAVNSSVQGATKEPSGSYLKVSASPAVMVVPEDLFEKFNLKAEDLAETQPAK